MGPQKHPSTSSLVPQALTKCPMCVRPSILQGIENTAKSKIASFLPTRGFIFQIQIMNKYTCIIMLTYKGMGWEALLYMEW